MMRFIAVVLGLVAIACGSAATTRENSQHLDAGAQLACREHESLSQDLRAGVVTDAELRQRMRVIYDEAKAWPDSEVTQASAALVAELNTGKLASAAAIERLVRACGG